MNIALYCLIVVDNFFLGKNSYLSSLQGLTAFETHGKDVCGVAVSNHNGDSKAMKIETARILGNVRYPKFGLFQSSLLPFHLNQLNSKGVYLISGKENRYPDCSRPP